ncbi:hypothetical protein Tco_1496919, partial [Tanacetum coccineum]
MPSLRRRNESWLRKTSKAPSSAKRSKAGKVTKKRQPKSSLQLIDEVIDEGVLDKEPLYGDEEADTQREIEESLKEVHGRIEVREKKVKVEQVALDLLTHETPNKKSPTEQYIFQRRTSTPTESFGHDESSSLYAELGQIDSETKSDEEVPGIIARVQDEGQAGPNLGEHDEGQAGPNPGDVAASQPLSSHVVHENLKLPTEGEVRLEEPASSAGTLSSLQHLDKELSFADQFLVEKSHDDETEKTNTESEVHLSPVSTTIQAPLPTSTTTVTAITTTTTSLPSIPPQPQQGSSDSILIQCIGELEQHMADMVEANQALEERLDKQGNMLYNLENLDIPHKVSKAVDKIVTDAVDWAIQAPLRDRFRDLPEADMKEILHHRMWESNSYKAHEDHKKLYEALEQSMARDHTDQLLTDLAEARKKKKKRHDSPKTPPGSPPHQPPPPLPPAGPSGTSGASGASGSS